MNPDTFAGPNRHLVENNRRAGRNAFAWVLAFLAWHVVWFATGLAFPSSSHFAGAALVVYRLVSVLINMMVVVGCLLPLALFQRWGERFPGWMLVWASRTAALILLARGAAGVLDLLLRVGGLSGGLTGLTMAETVGTSDITLWIQVSGVMTDVLFLTGALAFARAAIAYDRLHQDRQPGRRDVASSQ